jgi:replicative DNA helicase
MAENAKGDFLRKPPASVEAEQAVLSSIITNNKAFERVSEFLRPEHFTEGLHRKIYEACSRLVEKGHLADAITVKNYLELKGEMAEGGAKYLAELAGSAVSVVNAYDYGRLVYEMALKRDLIGIGTDIVNGAFGGESAESSAQDQIEKAEQKLYELATEGVDESGLQNFEDTLGSSMSMIEQAYKSDGSISGVSTGFDALDKKLGGLQPSDLIIIASRPGMGKTALSLNIAFNVANEVLNGRAPEKLKGPVAFFSLEMSSDQLAGRVLSFSAEVPSHKMRTGSITEEEFTRVAEHSRALSTLPMFIDDTPDITVSGIRTRARRLKRIHGGLSLIVIDYIQLISSPGGRRQDNRVQEVSEITRGLKILAKELDVPVIALSQLSRLVEQREDKRPQLADLRESGSIEQDADVVMFIYREAYYEEGKKPEDTNGEAYLAWRSKMDRIRNKATLIIAKQRHGPTGDVSVAFVGEYVKFGNFYDGTEKGQ